MDVNDFKFYVFDDWSDDFGNLVVNCCFGNQVGYWLFKYKKMGVWFVDFFWWSVWDDFVSVVVEVCICLLF